VLPSRAAKGKSLAEVIRDGQQRAEKKPFSPLEREILPTRRVTGDSRLHVRLKDAKCGGNRAGR
jgi:hypothetical protein